MFEKLISQMFVNTQKAMFFTLNTLRFTLLSSLHFLRQNSIITIMLLLK